MMKSSNFEKNSVKKHLIASDNGKLNIKPSKPKNASKVFSQEPSQYFLTSYFQEVLNFAPWNSISNFQSDTKMLTAFLFKLYGTNNGVLDITELLSFFEITKEDFLQTGMKIITGDNDEESVKDIINALKTQEVNYNNSKQREFVGEILIPFDSILKSTSIDLWNAKTLQDNLKLASEKLKARVEASKTHKATELTAEAFAKASKAAATAANEHATVNIRLNNLEKANRIDRTKNYKGGRSRLHFSQKNQKTASTSTNTAAQTATSASVPNLQ
jgi:hypothetical protein